MTVAPRSGLPAPASRRTVSRASDPCSRPVRLTEPCGGRGQNADKTPLCAEFTLQISTFSLERNC